MTHRHIPGTDPLAPQPYSAAEVADLVERVRARQTVAHTAGVRRRERDVAARRRDAR